MLCSAWIYKHKAKTAAYAILVCSGSSTKSCPGQAEHSRVGQGRAGPGRAGQGRVRQGRATWIRDSQHRMLAISTLADRSHRPQTQESGKSAVCRAFFTRSSATLVYVRHLPVKTCPVAQGHVCWLHRLQSEELPLHQPLPHPC